MILTTWKPRLLLMLIFVVGMVTGGALTVAVLPMFTHQPGEPQMRKHWMSRLTHELNLSPEQQDKIQPIVNQASDQIQFMHRMEAGHISQIIDRTNARIAELLTPEQQPRLQALQREMEKDRERMFPGRPHWGDPHGPFPFPPPPNGPPPKTPLLEPSTNATPGPGVSQP